MLARHNVPVSLVQIGRDQYGAVTTGQIRAAGLSRHTVSRLVADRIWRKLDRGLYLMHNGPPTWMSYVYAGLAIAGADAYTTSITAAALHGLTAQRRLPIHVAVPDRRKLSGREWLVVHRPTQLPDRLVHSGPARPPIPEVVLEACSSGSAADIATWIYEAVGSAKTTPTILLEELAKRDRIAHRKLIRAILLDAQNGINSHLEREYLYRVERPHGLPIATRQFVVPHTNKRADAAYEEYRLLIELDGEAWHSGQRQFRDRRRDNRHTVFSWGTLRFGWPDIVGVPCGVARDVADQLVAGGWDGALKRCKLCR